MKNVDLLVIGGGSAGMAAATAAYDAGVKDILIIERGDKLGGILCQCIHNGFGLHRYGRELTGSEYAKISIDEIRERDIKYILNSFVIEITKDRIVTVINPEEGQIKIKARAVILAMGCRERARGALMIPGTRPAGVITAGAAQKYLNIKGYLPGKEVVILGSGDIGLIMARQLTLEGISVKEIIEIMPYSSGLSRNIVQCLDDFDIPLSLSSMITRINGRKRVSSVIVSKVDENRMPIPGSEREIKCDTLMISVGLIPENELSRSVGVELSQSTKGAVVNELLQTSVPGVFACGNVLHVHDLVDNVSAEGEKAGRSAAKFLLENMKWLGVSDCIQVKEERGVGGLVPQFVTRESEDITLQFRPKRKYINSAAVVRAEGKIIAWKNGLIFTPGEMVEMTVARGKINGAQRLSLEIMDFADVKCELKRERNVGQNA